MYVLPEIVLQYTNYLLITEVNRYSISGQYNNAKIQETKVSAATRAIVPYNKKEKGNFKSWERRFQQLVEYKQQNGNCNVSTQDEANKQLGLWVDRQRQLFKKGKLSSEQIESMNGIGFSWNLDEDKWNEMFDQLKDYKKDNGDCNVSTLDKDYKKLGSWVSSQRTAHKNNKL